MRNLLLIALVSMGSSVFANEAVCEAKISCGGDSVSCSVGTRGADEGYCGETRGRYKLCHSHVKWTDVDGKQIDQNIETFICCNKNNLGYVTTDEAKAKANCANF